MPSDSKKKREQKKKEAAKKRDVKKPSAATCDGTNDDDIVNGQHQTVGCDAPDEGVICLLCCFGDTFGIVILHST